MINGVKKMLICLCLAYTQVLHLWVFLGFYPFKVQAHMS